MISSLGHFFFRLRFIVVFLISIALIAECGKNEDKLEASSRKIRQREDDTAIINAQPANNRKFGFNDLFESQERRRQKPIAYKGYNSGGLKVPHSSDNFDAGEMGEENAIKRKYKNQPVKGLRRIMKNLLGFKFPRPKKERNVEKDTKHGWDDFFKGVHKNKNDNGHHIKYIRGTENHDSGTSGEETAIVSKFANNPLFQNKHGYKELFAEKRATANKAHIVNQFADGAPLDQRNVKTLKKRFESLARNQPF